MRFNEYIDESPDTLNAFAKFAGVPSTTAQRVYDGMVCTIVTAHLIVKACHARPTPSGGVVTLEELVPSKVDAA